MKLRTRLFLWVGIIFLLAFGISLFFETHTTADSLRESEKNLRQQILKHSETHRQNLEEFLHVSISEDQAEIDSLLLRIARDPNLGATLFLNPSDLKIVAPAHSTFIYKNDRWIDFLQTTKDGMLTSLLIPIDFPMLKSHQIIIDKELSWILLDRDREMKHPYIGVRLFVNPKKKISHAASVDELIEVDWGLTIFFHPEDLKVWERKNIQVPEVLEEVDFAAFLDAVDRASEYVKSNDQEGWIQKDILEKSENKPFSGKAYDEGIRCLREEGEALNDRIIQLLQRGDQAIMLSSLASLFISKEFGDSPLAPQAPRGVSRFPKVGDAGYLILADEVFFEKLIFNDEDYLKSHPASQECAGIGSSIAVIAPKNTERVFIGNALSLQGEDSSGFLTIGIDANEIVQDLVLSIHQDAFLVHKKRVVSAYTDVGKPITDFQEIPFEEKMLKSKNGLISWKGQSYYFLHMQPFHGLDLHFFILEPENKAFALVDTIREGSMQVIRNVSWNMRIISVVALLCVLFLLDRVSRKITKPITALAKVTEDVASGRLEGIKIPKVPEGRHDEIQSLCHSFGKMVVGLQEKEKVKGILNKVVSPEIAQEISKGAIHLGGEEKMVTVFFADIRSFTHITENMEPKDVVEMLNTCMTKVSHVIDEFGGVIDKYVGDEVMALFGAPIEKEDSTLKAIQCGLKIIEVLQQWNSERKAKTKEPIEMGIGIHTGVSLVGNMGAENRLNYTVLGSNVNLASRLCSYAKPLQILITKETLDQPHVQEQIEVEELPPMEFKGFEKPFVVYSVKGGKNV